MTRQCLKRRISDMGTLRQELSAWEKERNAGQRRVSWHFTTPDARIKPISLYPKRITEDGLDKDR